MTVLTTLPAFVVGAGIFLAGVGLLAALTVFYVWLIDRLATSTGNVVVDPEEDLRLGGTHALWDAHPPLYWSARDLDDI